MKKVKAVVVGAALALTMLGSAQPSQAMTCMDELEDACRVAATVICKVVAKGQPCLM